MGDIRVRLSSLSLPLIAVVSVAIGCGDNVPALKATGGSGGTSVTGTGGATGGTNGGSGGATGGMAGSSAGAGGGLGGIGGGSGGAAGSSAGAGGVGGSSAGAGGAPPPPCYTTAFTAPTSGATLTVSDDSNHTCADGFQYTVTISSSAPDGTDVTLYDGSTLLETVKVSGGAASFAVQLSTAGAQQLSIQYPSTQTCNVTENVTVTCPNSPPTCTISKPVISATHPELNGVPAPQGDRASSAGSPYQVTFVINTNAEDGQAVTLAVNSEATNPPTPVDGTPTANVSGGSATFGLTLVPDGTYDVTATCVNKNGITGTSTKSTFTVDTAGPDLTVTSPGAGQFVVGGTVNACAQTHSSDAASLAGSLGAGQQNLCVTLGSSATPSCVAVANVDTPTCVSFACPGSSPFSLTYTLSDAAGNPTTQTVTGVTCASALPSVQIVAPVSDAPSFNDKSKHILAASAPLGVKDEDPNTIGAQADVVACTDTAGTAALLVGHKGDANLVQLGTAVTTTATTGQCPAGQGNVAIFAGVTLPESNENGDGTLAAATELQVTVTAASNSADVGTSQPDDVWVDTTPPNLALVAPAGLCGSFMQSATTVTEDVLYAADDMLVVAEVTNNGATTTYDTPAFMNNVATFGSVAFTEGQNSLVATESDPAGNATELPACVVTIGMAPVVTFTTPTAGALLCPSGDATTGCIDDNDTGTAGWQGSLTVNVKAGATNVVGSVITFTDGATTFGTATTDANGNATLTPVTIAEGTQTIVATTDNVPGAGVGSGSVNVTVDTLAPNAPKNLNVSLLDRRKTSMQLTWTAPSDAGGGNVTGYQIRYAKVAIDSTNFNNNAVTTAVTYTGTPSPQGQPDGVTVSSLYIENDYYFAVEAIDIAGNVSTILSSAAPAPACSCGTLCCRAHFNVTTIPSVAGGTETFGFSIDGQGDLNGDKVSDVLIGTSGGGKAYLYFGNAAGANSTFSATAPSVTFSGAGANFGSAVAQIGDVDNDGLPDIAISDPFNAVKVYIFKGRATWPATLTDAQADYVISGDATYTNSGFGLSMARLGDFTGDGIDDFAIGADRYGTFVGRVIIIPGKATGFGSVGLPDTTNAIIIDGNATLGRPFFGESLVGLGHFYTVSSGTTLVVGSPGSASSATANAGHVYVFHGQSGSGGSISISSADQVIAGPGSGAFIGTVVSNLGPITGQFPNVGIGNPSDTQDDPGFQGTGFLMSGTPATGPLSNRQVFSQSGGTLCGPVVLGGGLSGQDVALSLIGSATPDFLFTAESGTYLTITDGTKIPPVPGSPIDTVPTADVLIRLPSGWTIGPNGGSIVPDINGDSYVDFVIRSAVQPGSVAVYY